MGQACTKHITYMISYHLPKNPVRGQETHRLTTPPPPANYTEEETKPVEVTLLI